MYILRELDTMKEMVMDRKSIDLNDRIWLRGIIKDIIQDVKDHQTDKIDVPEFMTIKRENIE